MTHTPGPWHMKQHRMLRPDDSRWTIIGSNNQGFACTVGLGGKVGGIGEATDKSNALLITAALDLLEACKFAADKSNDPALVEILDKAIAKAEGRSDDKAVSA